jgi:flagellar basal-body rod protein FlgC
MSLSAEGSGVRGLLRGLAAPASGLQAQKARIDTLALNLANAGTTAPPGEVPFQRRIVELQEGIEGQAPRGLIAPTPPVPPKSLIAGLIPRAPGDEGVRVAGILEDPSEGPLVYDPGHPHADEQGYVRLSNVDPTQALIELLEARRLFEANVSAFEAMKSILRRSIDI